MEAGRSKADDTCGVCRKDFGGNLRRLPCKHLFCVVCLNARVHRDLDGILILECPRCHVVTDFEEGETPETLPCADATSIAGSGNKNESTSGVQTNACAGACTSDYVGYCLTCKKGLCTSCLEQHRKNESALKVKSQAEKGHRFMVITRPHCAESDRNRKHERVTLYCMDCQRCICIDCANGVHDGHVIKNIDDVGEESRAALTKFVKVTCGSDPDDVIRRDRTLLMSLHRKYDSLDRDVTMWVRELRHLKQQMLDLETKMASVEMARFARFLCTEAGDAELMAHAQSFPLRHTPTGGVYVDTNAKRRLSHQMSCPASLGQQMTSHRVTFSTSQGSSGYPPSRLSSVADSVFTFSQASEENPEFVLKASFRPRGVCGGIALDPRGSQLVVRTSDPAAPIKTYSHAGVKVKEGGVKVAGLTGAFTSGIDVDTCRHLYLLVTPSGGGGNCGSSNVIVVDREGRKVKSYDNLNAGSLYDVAYNDADDLYAVADWDKNQVLLLDPRQGCPVGRFNLGYRRPFQLAWRSSGGQPTLLISDVNGDAITEVAIQGQLKRLLPSVVDGIPITSGGVCVDQSGYIMYCDHDNQRLIGCGGDDVCRTLLSANQLGGFPQYISYSSDDDMLAVAFRCGEVRLFERQINFQMM